ncbi:MAG: hypothetical protein KAS87_04210 [Candidatus Omnitrophica bacterium]|nr:hypothetical protein [Candidatus Omnitrophota bacterium]
MGIKIVNSQQSTVNSQQKLKVKKICFLFLVFYFLSSVFSFAQTPNTEETGLSKKISLDLRGVDITEVLKFLAAKGNLNIVSKAGVSGKVVLFLSDVNIKDALEVILTANKLAYEKVNGVIYVMTEAEYFALHGENFGERRKLKTLQLKYASAPDISAVLKEIKSSIGKVIVDKKSGRIILLDTPEKIAQMEKIIEKFDQLGFGWFLLEERFDLKYASAKEIKAKVSEILTKDISSLKVDERTNTLIISDLPDKIEEVRQMIRAFDSKPQQVLIEAKIVQVSLDDDFKMGIEWDNLFSKASLHSLRFTSSFPASSLSAYQKISVGTLATDDYTSTMNLLKTVGKTNLISSPRIAVLSGEEAKILVGTREAYVTQTISQAESTTTTAESIEYVDVGVKLHVTPLVHSDGYITMEIKPEVSSVIRTLTTAQGSQIPIIDTTEAETKVIVRDGVSVIIAGLIKDKKTISNKSVPFFGSIPLLGMLFRSKSEEIDKTETVVFLTPRIISGGIDESVRPKQWKQGKGVK